MLTRQKEISDTKLGNLKAGISFFRPSIIWKKRIDFLGFMTHIEISGTRDNLNNEERIKIIEALKAKEILESKALMVIKDLCQKQGLEFEKWQDYIECSRIYICDKHLYISISNHFNKLSYELELKAF